MLLCDTLWPELGEFLVSRSFIVNLDNEKK